MDLDSVTLEDALRLLSLPRTLGELDGELVTVQNGRYGPYVKKGDDSRSLESEDQMFTVTLDAAKELFAQPKKRGRAARAAPQPPLRELGADTASGKPIVLREGRWGPYVTDGETNASLRKGDTIESITTQRAIELLAERRSAAPAAKRRARGAARSGTGTSAVGGPGGSRGSRGSRARKS
jgi:DNA topoisomerase-1